MHEANTIHNDCFDNFWKYFQTNYSRKMRNRQVDCEAPNKVFNKIETIFIRINHDWNRNKDEVAARKFWQLVSIGRKFIENL